jgi:hypothetical protein
LGAGQPRRQHGLDLMKANLVFTVSIIQQLFKSNFSEANGYILHPSNSFSSLIHPQPFFGSTIKQSNALLS